MRKLLLILFFSCFYTGAEAVEILDLNTALQNTYKACAGIDDDLHDMKVKAGINTAVTGVGTGVGIGAAATGFVKASTDKRIEQLEKELKEQLNQYDGPRLTQAEKEAFLLDFERYIDNASKDTKDKATELKTLTDKSKKLGNWRTGLMAANTATNIAGAAIAGTNKVSADLKTQIDNCIQATKDLNNAIMQAKMNGEDITEAQQIYTACRDYEYVDISPINKRATGAMVSSIVGAGVGLAGTVTSGVANTDKTRNDNSEAGKKKEKDLNTASNVLTVGATAASATATVFNATQIAAIKKVAKVSESCTGVLK